MMKLGVYIQFLNGEKNMSAPESAASKPRWFTACDHIAAYYRALSDVPRQEVVGIFRFLEGSLHYVK